MASVIKSNKSNVEATPVAVEVATAIVKNKQQQPTDPVKQASLEKHVQRLSKTLTNVHEDVARYFVAFALSTSTFRSPARYTDCTPYGLAHGPATAPTNAAMAEGLIVKSGWTVSKDKDAIHGFKETGKTYKLALTELGKEVFLGKKFEGKNVQPFDNNGVTVSKTTGVKAIPTPDAAMSEALAKLEAKLK